MNMRMKLITELSQNVQYKESAGNVYIEGIFSSAEIMNNNGRKYKKDTLNREVNKILEKVGNKCLWGELGHPPTPEVNPDKIAILIEALNWMDDNNLEGRAKVIDTDSGRNAKVLIREGKLGISSRGLGTVNETDNYVNEDYHLITWDLVTDPSNNPSWVKGIYEGQEFDIKNGSENKIIEPEVNMDEVKKFYHKHVWQVIENIERSL